MDETVSYHFATVKQRRENRHEIDYQLTLRQQPKQSRMCGVGEKADRRPIDPPPIVQLKVVDSQLSIAEKNTYLQNPYYFMYASLMAADLDEELHLLRDGKTRSTTGSVVSSLYHLKDIDNTDAGFFVFPDLSVRMEGSYRLKLSLFEIIGKEVFHCRSIISNKFFVYSAKKFPGMEESTILSRSFADQGLKIRIRKELRQRRKLSKISDTEDKDKDNNNGASPSTSAPSSTNQSKAGKRPRKDEHSMASPSVVPHSQHHLHHRNDLPPNPTRYISYSSKQDVLVPPSMPDHYPQGPDTTRYYTPEDARNSMNHSSSSIAKSATLAAAAAATVAAAAAVTMTMPMERPKQYFLHSDTPSTSPSIYHHPQDVNRKYHHHPHEQQLQHVHHHHQQEIPMPHTNMMTSYSSTSAYSRSTTNNQSSYSYYSREQPFVSLPPPPNTFLPHPLPSPPPPQPPSSSSQQQ